MLIANHLGMETGAAIQRETHRSTTEKRLKISIRFFIFILFFDV